MLWDVGIRNSRLKARTSVPHLSQDTAGYIVNASELEPITLDPVFITDTYAALVAQQVFDGLVQFDANLNVVPCIAKSRQASYDGLVWTFDLRQGVKFHHGREVSADDFVYTFTRFLHPRTASPRAWLFERVQGAKEFLAGTAERLRGCKLWTPIHCKSRCLSLMHPLSAFWVWSRHRWCREKKLSVLHLHLDVSPLVQALSLRELGGRRADHPEANEEYFEGRPFLDHLHYHIIMTAREPWLSLSKHLRGYRSSQSSAHTPEK